MTRPIVIQGGMGVGASDWRLAQAVGRTGQMGVVSGTALDVVHARRLNDGDPGGHLRRAYAEFPVPAVVERVMNRWYVDGGRAAGERYKTVPLIKADGQSLLRDLILVANFAEVWLAKQGHDSPVGINFLEKIQMPIPHAIYGALLAGVDYVIMGAGIPADVPRVLNLLAAGEPASYRLSVAGAAPSEEYTVTCDPAEVFGGTPPTLARPQFLAIISSNTLASFLTKDPATTPDGFVVEGYIAGGHNAPPRGKVQYDESGQPVYGARDAVDPAALAKLGLPFWLAGGYADPERVRDALAAGACGVQVGTAFALCEESAFEPDLKHEIIRAALAGEIEVRTDPLASPSGYPFKVVKVRGTLSEADVYEARERVCDLGFLRTPYKKDDDTLGYRCPAEPVDTYVDKGGTVEETVGRKCLCNALLAAIGLAQVRPDGSVEPAIVTGGDDLVRSAHALAGATGRWTAAAVVDYLLARSVIRDAHAEGSPLAVR